MGRPYRGSRLSSFYADIDKDVAGLLGNDAQSESALSTFDSAFQIQEYIAAMVRRNPHDVNRIVTIPGRSTAADVSSRGKEKASEEPSIDEAVWIYEQLRRLAEDLTYPLVVSLQQECSRQTCPEMKAGEWLYLCVAHGSAGAMENCCAIDYIVHTLDSATALLNSPTAFPSRLSVPPASHRHFPSLARRLGRIFAHAYFHHRVIFNQTEGELSLYERFVQLSKRFNLVPEEFLVIPPHSDEEDKEVPRQLPLQEKSMTLLTRDDDVQESASAAATSSRPPRIGGRSRTDTMYLSGSYVSDSATHRRVPSPLAATLASEDEEEKPQNATQQAEAPSEEPTPASVVHVDEDESKMELDLVEPPPGVFVHDFAIHHTTDDDDDGDHDGGEEVQGEEVSEEVPVVQDERPEEKPVDPVKPEESSGPPPSSEPPSEDITSSPSQAPLAEHETSPISDPTTSDANMLKDDTAELDTHTAPTVTDVQPASTPVTESQPEPEPSASSTSTADGEEDQTTSTTSTADREEGQAASTTSIADREEDHAASTMSIADREEGQAAPTTSTTDGEEGKDAAEPDVAASEPEATLDASEATSKEDVRHEPREEDITQALEVELTEPTQDTTKPEHDTEAGSMPAT